MFNAINRKIKRWIIRQQKRQPIVLISDTTLRDGVQTPGVRVSLQGKRRIAEALARAGVHSIELGFPAASARETADVQVLAGEIRGPILTALSRTLPGDVERASEALAPCPILKRAITLFIGTSLIHRRDKLNLSESQVIRAAVRSVEQASRSFQIISVGAEDASRTDPCFLHEFYREVIAAGATSIGFADTVGILTPAQTARSVRGILDQVPNIDDALLGVHFHNDLGLATANSLEAVAAGANIVQCTINGIGERAGNAALEEVVVALSLHAGEYGRTSAIDLSALTALSRLVARATGLSVPVNKPVVGRNLFRTEAGVHQDGLLKNPETYLPFPPELVGAEGVELVLGPRSGRSAVRQHLVATGLPAENEDVERYLQTLKQGVETNDSAEFEELDDIPDGCGDARRARCDDAASAR
ncbi:MAG: pyruvate carboxyltransferase [Phycisphaerae bacterium]|nr:MAG: pyruvate carboxyltransferase [Planctomycetota bacterium]KAB2941011.1 MAG: pyruvate carboxyltransferase [Phycisphaerae bacterium]MBE7455061.1 pyruvate carboxyltransferase [Planctomycetia bacterium]MCK6464704.1 pyruvate carboxyltransferase [Phycisphaerae bacterium]MCL4718960.1 pyruvate carboxyltransferase [Phycisphaerae bacterium]